MTTRWHTDTEYRERQIQRQSTPEARVQQRWTWLKHKFKMTKDEYELKLMEQHGVCAICHTDPQENLSVDHDRSCCEGLKSCGKCVRALLCRRCNSVLGLMEENSDLLFNMVNYIDSWKDKLTLKELSE
jgi:hypothetical protein